VHLKPQSRQIATSRGPTVNILHFYDTQEPTKLVIVPNAIGEVSGSSEESVICDHIPGLEGPNIGIRHLLAQNQPLPKL
jgi:hypothetical protein